jgi:cytochrome c
MSAKNLLLAGCIAGGMWNAATPAAAQDAAAGQAVFKSQCGICHAVTAGKNMTGPSLFDIVGRKAGQVAGFHYSDANKNSGLSWDAATLDKYLTSPKDVVPHTIMAYPGLKDAQKRANLIAYLATLH